MSYAVFQYEVGLSGKKIIAIWGPEHPVFHGVCIQKDLISFMTLVVGVNSNIDSRLASACAFTTLSFHDHIRSPSLIKVPNTWPVSP